LTAPSAFQNSVIKVISGKFTYQGPCTASFVIWDGEHEQEDILAWIETENRRIKAVLTHNTETGQPEKEQWSRA